jgi:hypothetical protein
MVIHTCQVCRKNFSKKSAYINHTVNKKKPCTVFDYSPPNNQENIPHNNIKIINEDNVKIINDDNVIDKDVIDKDVIDKDVIDNNDNNDNNDVIEIDDDIINIKLKCIFCKKIFCRNDVLKKHLTRCKVRKEEDADKDKIIELLIKKDEQIEHLLGVISKLTENTNQTLTNAHNTTTESNNTNTNNGSIATNNGNITTNNIKIEFGKEDLKKITDDFFIKTLLNFSGAAIPSKIIEGIHFNPELKEFMNVFITDMSRNKAMIYDTSRLLGWCTQSII